MFAGGFWLIAGTAGDLVSIFDVRLSRYPSEARNGYCLTAISSMSQLRRTSERMRRVGTGSKDFHLTPNTPLPCGEAILKNSGNKGLLVSILCGNPLQNNAQLVNKLDCLVTHGEADITLCSYKLDVAASCAEMVRIVCDDTDVFVLLVYWTWSKTIRKNIQMEKWDGTVLDIRATVDKLEDKCGQLPGMHAMSGCDTVSYPCGNDKMSALKVLVNTEIDGLPDVLGEVSLSPYMVKRRPIP